MVALTDGPKDEKFDPVWWMNGVVRIKAKATKDEAIGWIIAKGNGGTQFLKSFWSPIWTRRSLKWRLRGAPIEAPSGIMGTGIGFKQIAAHEQAAMMDMLVANLTKETPRS